MCFCPNSSIFALRMNAFYHMQIIPQKVKRKKALGTSYLGFKSSCITTTTTKKAGESTAIAIYNH